MKRFRVLLADPPWRFGDSLPGKTRGASKRYRTLSFASIEAFKLPPLHDDALLFLWRVSAMVPEAYAVVRAWGFTPKSELVWVKRTKHGKLHFGMGRYTRASHETCIIARRGRPTIRDKAIRSVFEAPVRAHSEKPDELYAIIERLSKGPYCELFARRARKGWTSLGDQVGVR